jgi:hypothetical protein
MNFGDATTSMDGAIRGFSAATLDFPGATMGFMTRR